MRKTVDVTVQGRVSGLDSAAGAGVFGGMEKDAKTAEGDVVGAAAAIESGVGQHTGKAAEETTKHGKEMEGAFSGVKEKASDASGEVGGFVKTALGLGAFAGVGALLEETTKSTEEYQKAQADLNTALADTKQALPQDAMDQANVSMEKFGHTDSDTTEAMAELVRAGVPASQAMQDMGNLADFAAARHEDLSAAADEVIKGVQGQGRAFKELGIILPATIPTMQQVQSANDAVTKAQQNLNDAVAQHGPKSKQAQDAAKKLAEAQGKVTELTKEQNDVFQHYDSFLTGTVEPHVKGVADAQSKTLGGALSSVHASIDRVLESLGEKLAPTLESLAQWIQAHSGEISDDLGKAFDVVSGAVKFLGDHMNIVMPIIGLFVANWMRVKALHMANDILDLFKAFGQFGGKAVEVAQTIGSPVVNAFETAGGKVAAFNRSLDEEKMLASGALGEALSGLVTDTEAVGTANEVAAAKVQGTTTAMEEAKTAESEMGSEAAVAGGGGGIGALAGPLGMFATVAIPAALTAMDNMNYDFNQTANMAANTGAQVDAALGNIGPAAENAAGAANTAMAQMQTNLQKLNDDMQQHQNGWLDNLPFIGAAFQTEDASAKSHADNMTHIVQAMANEMQDALGKQVVAAIAGNADEMKKWRDQWVTDSGDSLKAIRDLAAQGDPEFQKMQAALQQTGQDYDTLLAKNQALDANVNSKDVDSATGKWQQLQQMLASGAITTGEYKAAMDQFTGGQKHAIDNMNWLTQATGKSVDTIQNLIDQGDPIQVNIGGKVITLTGDWYHMSQQIDAANEAMQRAQINPNVLAQAQALDGTIHRLAQDAGNAGNTLGGLALHGNGHAMGYASGGHFGAGETAMVGEHGPEIIQFDGNGTVYDAHQTQAMLSRDLTPMTGGGGGGGHTVNIVITGAQILNERDMDRFADALGQRIATQLLPGSGVRLSTTRR